MTPTALVIGKFMPPHLGHLHLFEVAAGWPTRLTIVVEHIDGEPIPSALRAAWVAELCPAATVVHLDQGMPQNPRRAAGLLGPLARHPARPPARRAGSRVRLRGLRGAARPGARGALRSRRSRTARDAHLGHRHPRGPPGLLALPTAAGASPLRAPHRRHRPRVRGQEHPVPRPVRRARRAVGARVRAHPTGAGRCPVRRVAGGARRHRPGDSAPPSRRSPAGVPDD